MKQLLSILFVVAALAAIAQPPGGPDHEERKEKIKAHKIAFISSELDLSPDEAEKFWPVYNKFEDEIGKIHDNKRDALKKLRKMEELSDEETYKLTKQVFEYEIEESKVRLKYLDKFSEVLNKTKAAKVFVAEEKFKRELLRRIKERYHGPGEGGGPPPGGGPRPE